MDSKNWYKSKTVIASLVTMIIGTLGMLGYNAMETEKDNIVEMIVNLVTLLSGLIAMIGRVQAKSKIKGPGVLSVLVIFFALTLFIGGCAPANRTFALEVDQASTIVSELNVRCQNGDDQACKQGLEVATTVLENVADGLNGRTNDSQ